MGDQSGPYVKGKGTNKRLDQVDQTSEASQLFGRHDRARSNAPAVAETAATIAKERSSNVRDLQGRRPLERIGTANSRSLDGDIGRRRSGGDCGPERLSSGIVCLSLREGVGRSMSAVAKNLSSGVTVPPPARHAQSPSISAGQILALLKFAEAADLDIDALCACAGFAHRAIADPDDRAPLSAYVALLDACVDMAGDPAFALRFGQDEQTAQLSIVKLLSGSAGNARQGHHLINRYSRLLFDGAGTQEDLLKLVRRDDGVWIELNSDVHRRHPRLVEVAFARCLKGIADHAGHRPFPYEIHFAYPEPAHRNDYDRTFESHLTFDTPWNAFRIDEAFLEKEIPKKSRHIEGYVFGVLKDRADLLLGKLHANSTMLGRVQRELLPVLHTGGDTLHHIATQLGMSRRTLHRRLKAEGTTFQSVLDDLRQDRAIYLLRRRQLSVNEVAYLVGFAEPSSFTRAFKRWTGHSPRAFVRSPPIS